jgi:shikimate dehydrogenase/3-dehydroquinate dehydratase type I
MKETKKAVCVSLSALGADEAKRLVDDLSPDVSMVELRLDTFFPEEVTKGAWKKLAADPARQWVLTWRSPGQGGAATRPPGILRQALESEFAWIDVEVGDLEAGDPESVGIPIDRRWVSHHETEVAGSWMQVTEGWRRVRAHDGALRKYVIPAERFEANTWILDLEREIEAEETPHSVFAQGWVGHVSRILGYFGGNAVTFVAPDKGIHTAPGQPTVDRVLREYSLPKFAKRPDLYGVLGDPAHDSRSPALHNHAFQASGVNGLYLPLESPHVEPVFTWFREGRLAGLSVTAPFKERVFSLVDASEGEAQTLGAVNTIWKDGDRLVGANTDVDAAREVLRSLDVKGEVAVVGAGGAATAVVGAASNLGFPSTIFNRSGSRGRTLAKRFGIEWGGALEDLNPADFAVVINATPMGGTEEIPKKLRRRHWSKTAILDLTYGPEPSRWERLGPAVYRGGLEFLARQAVGQFERWTGKRLPFEEFMKGLDA